MNKQRERLVELLEKASKGCTDIPCNVCKYVNERHCKARKFVDVILADGWMRPPCKVGQTVYWYDSAIHSKPYPMTVTGIADYGEGHMWVYCKNGTDHRQFRASSFGKTVFLTKEEAEEALSKLQASYKQVNGGVQG